MAKEKLTCDFTRVIYCLLVACIIVNVLLTIYVLLELQTLHKQYGELQTKVSDNFFIIQDKSKPLDQISDVRADKSLLRKGRQLTSHDFLADLLHAQAHILQAHCTNDSKLCMQGPKGEPGPKGDPGIPGPAIQSDCSCIKAPAMSTNITQYRLIRGQSVIINCPVRGTPEPIITWSKNDVRINNSTARNLTATTPGNYTCTAENIMGVASHSFYVT
ncbi:uncharacterized protein [Argopecten irradians]|uniref:uncharacterized protein n=1 Tax=Argopecten irradians TaxID=31199 RepID=UPI00371171CA